MFWIVEHKQLEWEMTATVSLKWSHGRFRAKNKIEHHFCYRDLCYEICFCMWWYLRAMAAYFHELQRSVHVLPQIKDNYVCLHELHEGSWMALWMFCDLQTFHKTSWLSHKDVFCKSEVSVGTNSTMWLLSISKMFAAISCFYSFFLCALVFHMQCFWGKENPEMGASLSVHVSSVPPLKSMQV